MPGAATHPLLSHIYLSRPRTAARNSAANFFALAMAMNVAGCGSDDSPGTISTNGPQTSTSTQLPAAEPPSLRAKTSVAISDTHPTTYEWDSLGVGKGVHVDVADSFTGVPGKYNGLKFLRTADADRFLGAAEAVSFRIDDDVDVLVAFDSASSTLPRWLASWTAVEDELLTSSGSYRIYRRHFTRGVVELGGNESGARTYFVVLDDGTALGNSAPTISGTAPAEIAVTRRYDFRPSAGDSDGDPLGFTASNLPVWATLDAATGALTGTPAADQTGTYADIVITVSDGATSASLQPFNVVVNAVDANSQPVISGRPQTVIVRDTLYTFVPTASDPDADPLRFTVTNLPRWAQFSSAIGRIRGVPGTGDVGIYPNILISVSDGEKTSALPPFAIEVRAVARPNTIPTIGGAPRNSIAAGDRYRFTPTAADQDGNPLAFSIENLPAWATFDHSTGQLAGTPSDRHVGIHAGIEIAVSDGTATIALPTFAIAVTAAGQDGGSAPSPNSPPLISGTPASVVRQGQTYAFTPSVTDTDGDRLTFAIANRPSWASFSTSTGRLSGTPSAADVGAHGDIVISVNDGYATRSLPAFGITVTPTTTGSATLSWIPPTQNSDGSPLTNLAGYRVYWGISPGGYTHSVRLNNPGLATFVVEPLESGTWYFAATAVNALGAESPLSNVGSKTIP
jgi:hypothetical protein